MARKTKRIGVVSDFHCGHRVGLTPPGFIHETDDPREQKWAELRKAQWEWYAAKIRQLQPIDALFVMGDCVDGASKKADGRDVVFPKEADQIDMAELCIIQVRAPKISMVFGTRYHVRDNESVVAGRLGGKCKLGSHEWVDVNGVVFDLKHKVGSSSIPHGRATALKRAELWNALWAMAGRQPRGDVILRGHVHYCEDTGKHYGEREVRAYTCPALQGVGTEFGAEQCEGLVDFGMLHFDVTPAGTYAGHKHIAVLPEQVARATKY